MGSFRASRSVILGASEIEGGTISAATKAGVGTVSTLNGLRPVINIVKLNNVIITTIQVALKGLTSRNDVDDVIGLAAGGAARLIKAVSYTHLTLPTNREV
mgnify:CR=1 FL=1